MTAVDTTPRPAAPAGPPPRTVWLVGGLIALAIALLAAVTITVWQWRARHGDGRQSATGAEHAVSAGVDGREAATLDVVSGTTTVTVRAADLGGTLFKAESPQHPSATVTDGVVQVRIDGGNASVVIDLNRDVRWTVRFTAGTNSNTADLRDLRRLAGVEYVGGVARIELSLPRPAGTVPVRMSGGTNSYTIHAPGGVPVKILAGGGASGVLIDGGPRHTGITAGASFASDGWDTATDRYDVANTAGFSDLVVDRY